MPGPSWVDLGLVAVLLGGTVAYLGAQPHNLGPSDESYFFYHAVRILRGQVPYRDFYELHVPLSQYLLAAVFWGFGTSFTTAKIAMALVHGATAVLSFAAARSLGVRRGLAVAGALTQLAVCESAWPYASPHWVAALVMMAILLVLCRARGRPSTRRLVALGGLTGALACVQHQNALPVALGLAAVVVAREAVARRIGRAPRGALRPVAVLALGSAAVALPFLLLHVLLAGPGAVFEQLVEHPLTGYRTANRGAWGEGRLPLTAWLLPYTFADVLKYLPVLIPLGMARAAAAWTARDREALERLVVLLILPSSAALSILYRPDFIHVAFIAPLFFVFLAETLEWALRALPRAARAGELAGAALSLALVGGMLVHLEGNRRRMQRDFRFPVETAFGRVDFERRSYATFVSGALELLERTGTRELFCYPVYTSLYLMSGAHNPTRHDFMLPGYKTEEHYREVLAAIEAHELPFLMAAGFAVDRGDAFFRYVDAHYGCIDSLKLEGDCVFYRRSAEPGSPAPVASG